MSTMRADCVVGPWYSTRAWNHGTAAFRAYVDQMLDPGLLKGDMALMDNLPAHKVAGVRDTIKAAGAGVLCLPAYSPDLNSIEDA